MLLVFTPLFGFFRNGGILFQVFGITFNIVMMTQNFRDIHKVFIPIRIRTKFPCGIKQFFDHMLENEDGFI